MSVLLTGFHRPAHWHCNELCIHFTGSLIRLELGHFNRKLFYVRHLIQYLFVLKLIQYLPYLCTVVGDGAKGNWFESLSGLKKLRMTVKFV